MQEILRKIFQKNIFWHESCRGEKNIYDRSVRRKYFREEVMQSVRSEYVWNNFL